jgi:hypothetical protein
LGTWIYGSLSCPGTGERNIRDCTNGITINGPAPTIQYLKISNTSADAINVLGAGSAPYLQYSTIDTTSDGIDIDAGDISIITSEIKGRISSDCIDIATSTCDLWIDEGWNDFYDPGVSGFAISEVYPSVKTKSLAV